MAAGAVGVLGRPAAEERCQGLDSVTTQRPAVGVLNAEDWSRSLPNAFRSITSALT